MSGDRGIYIFFVSVFSSVWDWSLDGLVCSEEELGNGD